MEASFGWLISVAPLLYVRLSKRETGQSPLATDLQQPNQTLSRRHAVIRICRLVVLVHEDTQWVAVLIDEDAHSKSWAVGGNLESANC